MTDLKAVLEALMRERGALLNRLDGINRAISALGNQKPRGIGGRRKLSPEGLRRIRAAQQKRWAEWRKAQPKRRG